MNFLSHYYFERFHHDPEWVMGSIFPDLFRNAEPKIHLHPDRYELAIIHHPGLKKLYEGWQRHLKVDRYFHNAPFFYAHVHELKVALQPHIIGTDIRPSFMAHIGLELLLDHLLLKKQMVHDQQFYNQLEQVDRSVVTKFLQICGVQDVHVFFKFFDSFLSSRYVSAYRDLAEVTKALTYICKRLWKFELSVHQMQGLQAALIDYATVLEPDFKNIFDEIEPELW